MSGYLNSRLRSQHKILDAASSVGAGSTLRTEDADHIVVRVTTDASGSGISLECRGALQSLGDENADGAINFGAAKSEANPWENIVMTDLESGNPVAGSTGLVTLGANQVRLFEIEINGIDLINFYVSGIVAGAVSVLAVKYSNA